jgi:hypothetical protein
MKPSRWSVLGSLILSLAAAACGGDEPAAPEGPGAAGGTSGAGAAGQGSSGQAGQGGQAGASGAAGGSGAGQGAPSLTEALDAGGFDTQEGVFSFLDLSACCATSCLGNNPSSPYGAFFLPEGSGQTSPNPGKDAQGRSPTYRLRADEVLLYVGMTPPRMRYFGFTPYLSQRTEGGKSVMALASLSETLNNAVIGVDGGPEVFDRPTVLLAGFDQGVDARVRDALRAAGYPESSFNSLVFDPSRTRPGLDEASDTLAVLFRMAIPEDAAKADAYRVAPPGVVLRVTPRSPAEAQPFPPPPPRPKDTTSSEAPLGAAVDDLEKAIAQAFPDHTGKVMVTTKGVPSPDDCIAGTDACAYDNRDTIYPATIPQKLLENDEEFLIVYGVNHEATGKAVYASASVYAIEHLFGVASVTSADYAGSASAYLPGHPDAEKLYAWKIARSCGGAPGCLEIPVGSCPDGVALDAALSIAFRVYLEPSSGTAADPSTLVIDRVMRFSPK